MTARIYIAVLTLLGIFGAAVALKGHGMPTQLAIRQLKLDAMPLRFESWTGEDVPLEPEVFRESAEMAITRCYRDKDAVVDLHADVFTSAFMQCGVRILHPPELCYRSNGYSIESEEAVQIRSPGDPPHPARFLSLSREGSRSYCLYWYQVGDATFWNSDDQRRVVHSFRGRATWPPMIKVMLQTSADSPADAEQTLESLAVLVYPWIREYR